MVVYHAELRLVESNRERALEMLTTLVEKSRAEDGVVEYHAAVDVTDPTVVRLIEEFEDALPELLAGEPRIVRLAVAEKSVRNA